VATRHEHQLEAVDDTPLAAEAVDDEPDVPDEPADWAADPLDAAPVEEASLLEPARDEESEPLVPEVPEVADSPEPAPPDPPLAAGLLELSLRLSVL
jgi:hypothetical protein